VTGLVVASDKELESFRQGDDDEAAPLNFFDYVEIFGGPIVILLLIGIVMLV